MMSHDNLKHQASQLFCCTTKYSVVRHESLLAYKVTLYHDNYAHRYCNTSSFRFTISEVLRHVTSLLRLSGMLQRTYSMNTYVLLHFEHRKDVTTIIKLQRATLLRLLALCKSLGMIATPFLYSKCNRT